MTFFLFFQSIPHTDLTTLQNTSLSFIQTLQPYSKRTQQWAAHLITSPICSIFSVMRVCGWPFFFFFFLCDLWISGVVGGFVSIWWWLLGFDWECDYLVKVLLIGDSAVGNLNFCPDLLGTRSAYSRFTSIYLYTYLYVLCNLDPGCLYIYACVYKFFFFFGEDCAYNLDMWFF